MNKIIKRVAIFIAIAGVLLGLAASVRVAYEIAGGGGVVVALLVFPLTFVYLPFYTLLVYGSWNLLLLNYGSIAVSWVLLNIPDKLEKPPQSALDEPPTQPVATNDTPTLAIILVAIG